MWDKPETLNAYANLLFGLATLLILYAIGERGVHLPVFVLKEVRLNGALDHVTREQVEIVVRRELKGNFFTLDLNMARAAFQKLPWVRNASVRRRWPDALDVTLEEHVALARWGSVALVNNHGEVFEAASDAALPMFNGPPGSVQEVARQYQAFSRHLEPLGQKPVQLILTQRGAWQARLENGMVIELGREQAESRLKKFVTMYDRSAGRFAGRLDYVDLRYANGFAVRVPQTGILQAGGRKS